MSDVQIEFVRLDRDLARDPNGVKLDELRRRLEKGSERCRSSLDQGVAFAEARRISALMTAYGSALMLLPILWQLQQRQRRK